MAPTAELPAQHYSIIAPGGRAIDGAMQETRSGRVAADDLELHMSLKEQIR